MDLVWLEHKQVLHVIYTHICYRNAAFFASKSAEGLSQLFIEIRVTV